MSDGQTEAGLPDMDSWWAAARERDEAAVRHWKQSPEGEAWRDEAIAEYFAALPPGDEELAVQATTRWRAYEIRCDVVDTSTLERMRGVSAVVLDLQRRRDEEAGWLSPGKAAGLRTQLADRGSVIERLKDEAEEMEHAVAGAVNAHNRCERLRRQLDDRNGQIADLRAALVAAHHRIDELTATLRDADAGIFHGWHRVATLPKAGKLIYLASPYSHEDAYVRGNRVCEAGAAMRELTRLGHIVFSPISTSGVMVSLGVLSWDDPWWYEWSMAFLRRADECWVLMTDGWEESVGVENEMEYAAEHGMPVRYVDPETLEVRNEP
jgi:hypothetical protein